MISEFGEIMVQGKVLLNNLSSDCNGQDNGFFALGMVGIADGATQLFAKEWDRTQIGLLIGDRITADAVQDREFRRNAALRPALAHKTESFLDLRQITHAGRDDEGSA